MYRIFTRFREQLQKQHIPLLSIRHVQSEEELIRNGGDLDFLIPPDARDTVLNTLFSECLAHGCSFLLNRKKPHKIKAILYSAAEETSAVLEFWTSLEVAGDPQVEQRIEWERLQPYVREGEHGYSLDANIEALYYLSHLLTKKKNLASESVIQRLQHYRRQPEIEAPVKQLYEQLQSGATIRAVAYKAHMLLADKGVLPRTAVPRMLQQFRRKSAAGFNRCRGANRIIAILGPDGVGKTAVINAAADALQDAAFTYRFKNYYRSAVIYRLLYPLVKWYLRRRDGKTYKRNQIEEMFLYPLYNLSVLRYYLNISRFFIRKLQITDRYFYDYMLSGSRLKNHNLERHPKWAKMLKKVPRTLAVVQVDAENERIHSRRRELSDEHINSFRNEYFYLSTHSRTKFYVYLYNGDTLEHTMQSLMYFLRYIK